MTTRYRWTQRRLQAILPAADFARWLQSLPDNNPATIVAAAADRRSPAHRLFEWSDKAAAAEMRLLQARIILGSFVIDTEVTSKGNRSSTISAPYVMRAGPGQYEVTAAAMRDSEKRDYILADALREATRWRRRYAALSQLSIVFSALDAVESRGARAVRKR
jgi:hypothetical protein